MYDQASHFRLVGRVVGRFYLRNILGRYVKFVPIFFNTFSYQEGDFFFYYQNKVILELQSYKRIKKSAFLQKLGFGVIQGIFRHYFLILKAHSWVYFQSQSFINDFEKSRFFVKCWLLKGSFWPFLGWKVVFRRFLKLLWSSWESVYAFFLDLKCRFFGVFSVPKVDKSPLKLKFRAKVRLSGRVTLTIFRVKKFVIWTFSKLF